MSKVNPDGRERIHRHNLCALGRKIKRSLCVLILTTSIPCHAGLRVYAGLIWSSYEGDNDIPTEKFCVFSALDSKIVERIHKEADALPTHRGHEFIPGCAYFVNILVIEDATDEIVACHTIYEMYFASVFSNMHGQKWWTIFPDTRLCYEIGKEIISAMERPFDNDSLGKIPSEFVVVTGEKADEIRSRFLKTWRTFATNDVAQVRFWLNEPTEPTGPVLLADPPESPKIP